MLKHSGQYVARAVGEGDVLDACCFVVSLESKFVFVPENRLHWREFVIDSGGAHWNFITLKKTRWLVPSKHERFTGFYDAV